MAFEATSLLDLRHRFLVGSGRPSVLMLIRSPRYRETNLALELFETKHSTVHLPPRRFLFGLY